jgi:ketosteroid isomerase-like protein
MLSKKELTKIKNEIKQAALDHLYAKDATEALNNYTKNIIAVSNEKLMSSSNELVEDIEAYYKILKKVNEAHWDDIYIQVINKNTAVFTAKFFYSFTKIDDEKIVLRGIWTAIYIRKKSGWKIQLRHESYTQM